MLDEIIKNQRPSSDRFGLGYKPENNDNYSSPITPIHEVGIRSFADVLKSLDKEKDTKKVSSSLPMLTKEPHRLEEL